MAEAINDLPDPLLTLRQSIASDRPPRSIASGDTSTATVEDLSTATHLHFPHLSDQAFSLDSSTRFQSGGESVDLRSIFFAWQKKDVAIPDYISSTQQLNEQLSSAGIDGKVRNLVFVERLDLITWLEGASDESEFIKPLDSETAAAQVAGSVQVTSTSAGGPTTLPSAGAGAGAGKPVSQQLREIFNNERRMGDRNTVLRGAKPTDFSKVRAMASEYLGHNKRQKTSGTVPTTNDTSTTAGPPANATLPTHAKKSSRRPDPIILLSPSASSLLRMSNIKSFLESGIYGPPDTSSVPVSILHTPRLLPTIEPNRPLRFILVDTPDQFKPDYWDRVVAVFTTGQTWQFKGYKWQNAAELFDHALGVYVGWRGETIPEAVKGWGKGVKVVGIDKYNPSQGAQGRWRDREVVEGLWSNIEESMRLRGWGREGGPGEKP